MVHLLCLGDSITDCGRLFTHPPLGNGYVYKLREKLEAHGSDFHITNLGVDGFTVSRLLEMVKHYPLPHSADMISVLIGINDIGLMMNTGRNSKQKYIMMDEFLKHYENLLLLLNKRFQEVAPSQTDSTRCQGCQPPVSVRQKPRIILMEPFVFSRPARYINWIPHIRTMSQGICSLAEMHQYPYIRLHDLLNEEALKYGTDSVSEDGVHLTAKGHEILAEQLFRHLPL